MAQSATTLGAGDWTRRSLLARIVAVPAGLLAVRLAVFGALLVAWQLGSQIHAVMFWISSPTEIMLQLWSWIADESLIGHLWATLEAMSIGYVLGCFLGICAGLAFGFMPRLHLILSPYVTALYALPKIALAPLFVILLGIDVTSKVALVVITVFFPLLTSTLDGVRNVDRDMIQSLSVMGASRREIIFKVLIPGSMSWIFTGMRISVRYAFTAAILGEIIASNRGLGFLIQSSAGSFDSAGLLAAIIVLVICSLSLTELLTRIELSSKRGRA